MNNEPMSNIEIGQPEEKDDEASTIDLLSPYTFIFDWYSGPVLRYNTEYGISIFIKKVHPNAKAVGAIRINEDHYPVTEELADKIQSHVRDNFKELTELALQWDNSRMMAGVADTMKIKCDAVMVQLGQQTVPSDKVTFIKAFEDDIERFVRESGDPK